MSAPNSCDPCGCVTGNMQNDYFKQAVVTLLCEVAESEVVDTQEIVDAIEAGAASTVTAVTNGASSTVTAINNESTAVTSAIATGQTKTQATGASAIVAGSLPITTGGASVLTNASSAKIVTVYNTTDKPLLISLDAGSSYTVPVPATSGTATIDLGASGLMTAQNIFAKAIGANTSTGSLYIAVIR